MAATDPRRQPEGDEGRPSRPRLASTPAPSPQRRRWVPIVIAVVVLAAIAVVAYFVLYSGGGGGPGGGGGTGGGGGGGGYFVIAFSVEGARRAMTRIRRRS